MIRRRPPWPSDDRLLNGTTSPNETVSQNLPPITTHIIQTLHNAHPHLNTRLAPLFTPIMLQLQMNSDILLTVVNSSFRFITACPFLSYQTSANRIAQEVLLIRPGGRKKRAELTVMSSNSRTPTLKKYQNELEPSVSAFHGLNQFAAAMYHSIPPAACSSHGTLQSIPHERGSLPG